MDRINPLRPMSLNGTGARESAETRLAQLDARYRRAEEALAAATAHYESLREPADSGERQIRQALLRMQRAQKQLDAIQDEMERLEDEDG